MQRGFTLLELTLVMALAGILVAVMAPQMSQVSKREMLIAESYSLAGKVSQSREFALNQGTCYVLEVVGRAVKAYKLADPDCNGTFSGGTISSSGGGTATLDNQLSYYLPSDKPTLSLTASASTQFWLPNGWARGDNMSVPEGDVSDDDWNILITDSLMPAGNQKVRVVARPSGLVCVNSNGATTCP